VEDGQVEHRQVQDDQVDGKQVNDVIMSLGGNIRGMFRILFI